MLHMSAVIVGLKFVRPEGWLLEAFGWRGAAGGGEEETDSSKRS